MNRTMLLVFLAFLIVGTGGVIYQYFHRLPAPKRIDYPTLVQMVQSDELVKITVKDSEAVAVDKHGNEYQTQLDFVKRDLVALASEKDWKGAPHVATIEDVAKANVWTSLSNWLPILAVVGCWLALMRWNAGRMARRNSAKTNSGAR
jgi:ATP-dependent Zn protease